MVELSTRQLAHLVFAARKALTVTSVFRQLTGNEEGVPEMVSGELVELLYQISGEELTAEQDFQLDSRAWRLIINDAIADDQVAILLENMAKRNGHGKKEMKLYTRDEIEKFLDANGGYAADRGYLPPKDDGVL